MFFMIGVPYYDEEQCQEDNAYDKAIKDNYKVDIENGSITIELAKYKENSNDNIYIFLPEIINPFQKSELLRFGHELKTAFENSGKTADVFLMKYFIKKSGKMEETTIRDINDFKNNFEDYEECISSINTRVIHGNNEKDLFNYKVERKR